MQKAIDRVYLCLGPKPTTAVECDGCRYEHEEALMAIGPFVSKSAIAKYPGKPLWLDRENYDRELRSL